MSQHKMVCWFEELGLADIPTVGGKNASLGEMIKHLAALGVKVPGGFATTTAAYQDFLAQNGLNQEIYALLKQLDVDDVSALAKTGAAIRDRIMKAPFSPAFEQAISVAFTELEHRSQQTTLAVAVRSSATAEDLPTASFAGQQESFLNVRGLAQVLQAIKAVFASLFNDRAIAYRVHQNFDHSKVALSAGVQQMVRSDIGASGVMFTLDTESGFDQVILITSSYGLGEAIVQGAVNPDEFYVYKPALAAGRSAILRRHLGTKLTKMVYGAGASQLEHAVKVEQVNAQEQQRFSLNDQDIAILAQNALLIEKHYQCPMDIEWGKDGENGQLYILQARPETVKSRVSKQVIERYELEQTGIVKVSGRSIGQKIGQGTARIILNISEMARVQAGDVLVTDMTDPDWEPIMKRAAAIVTNRGGRTCHAAIIARELGIPAIVGCGDATHKIREGEAVTVSCAEGETGQVYAELLPFKVQRVDIAAMPALPVKIMLNVGNPERAFDFRNVPNEGIGLARLEFIISNTIGVHPNALLNYASLPAELQVALQPKIGGYASPTAFYIEKLAEGIAHLAAAFYPKKVIVRLSDFKSNEYANLLGGSLYEPQEENPMLGFRGASRYVDPAFRPCFELECQALRKVRNDMGLTNVEVMVPFVRTVAEAKAVVDLLAANGLKRGDNGLRIIMMCEIPANALLAEAFLEHFDGFSIGSNDLTQLTLGLDRDSGIIAAHFDERNDAVKALLHQAIQVCKKANKYIGICGQGPSDHPDFAEWLVAEGIDSLSLNPDSVLTTWLYLAKRFGSA